MTDTEIDEAVAVKLGWVFKNGMWYEPSVTTGASSILPDFCHSLEAAGGILELVDAWKLEGSGGKVSASLVLDDSPVAFSKDDTAPMAICKAFLKLDLKCLPS